jgi:signal transduction histidine kinase/CheY-like chemotaxis protein
MSQETILVLVVDDEPVVRQLYADLLGEHGYRVVIAQDAKEGLDTIRRADVAVVLMDILMPGMTGLEALEIAQEMAPETPVIMVTSHPTSEHAIRALKLGAYDFLAKGFRPEELLRAVQRALERRKLMLENTRLIQGLHEKVQELSTLMDVGRTLNATLDLDELLGLVMRKAQEILKAEASSLMLIDEKTDELYFSVALGERAATIKDARLKIGQGIAGWVAQKGEPLLVPDVQTDPRFYPGMDAVTGFQTRSVLCVPIQAKGETIGVVEVLNRVDGGQFQEKDIALLSAVAAQAGIAIQNARLYGETERRNVELGFLLQSSQDLLSALDPDTIFSRMVVKLLDILPVARTGVILLEDEEVARIAAGSVDARRLPPDRCTSGKIQLALYPEIREASRTRRPVVISDAWTDPLMAEVRKFVRPIGLRSLLVMPMLDRDRVFGVITVAEFEHPRQFSVEEIRLCETLANQASIAVVNARLYQELRQQTEQVERASQHKSQFISTMAHELRNPLNSIIGFTELLRDQHLGPLNEKQAKYVAQIHASGKHLLRLINDTQDLSRVEAGKLEVHPEPLPLVTALEESQNLIRSLALKKGIALDLVVDPSLPPVLADPGRLQQIMFNLLSNAIKYTPSGGTVTVSATTLGPSPVGGDGMLPAKPDPLAAEPTCAAISVTDTGIGIKPEDQGKLFQAFVRLENHHAKTDEGTGLGLSLSKKLVELLGGKIWFESDEAKGSSRFTFTLPLQGRTVRVQNQADVAPEGAPLP